MDIKKSDIHLQNVLKYILPPIEDEKKNSLINHINKSIKE